MCDLCLCFDLCFGFVVGVLGGVLLSQFEASARENKRRFIERKRSSEACVLLLELVMISQKYSDRGRRVLVVIMYMEGLIHL